MKRYNIFIKDTEPTHGGVFHMETIESIDEKNANIVATLRWGWGAWAEEVKDEHSSRKT